MAERIPQSTAYLVVFRAYLSDDGSTLATGKTIAMTISKNGGAFGNPNAGATNATEISSGFYKFTLDTTDTNTIGPLTWRGAEGTINDAGDVLSVVAATDCATQASVDAIQTDVDALTTAIAAIENQTDDIGVSGAGLSAVPWNAAWDAEVQSEVADALAVMFSAARSEPAQGAPSASATALEKLDFVYKLARNKLTQTATTLNVFADDGTTVDHKATVSDNGTTYTRGEIVSGP